MNRIIIPLIITELKRACHLHGTSFNSPHEGYAVIREELDELWEEIKKKNPDKDRLLEEAVRIGAMAMKFVQSFENWYGPEEPEDMDTCDDCGAEVGLGSDDFLLESGTYGIPKGRQSKMVCKHCFETMYAGEENDHENN